MAVQIVNDMPDAAVSRGEPALPLRDWKLPAVARSRNAGRAVFITITVALHGVAALAFMSVKYAQRQDVATTPIIASIIEAPAPTDEAPPLSSPPLVEVSFALPQPEQLTFESEAITPPPVPVAANAIAPAGQAVVPPLVESVEYVRAPAPVYPRESSRRREYGTVTLRVLVDPVGRPARVQVERSSGFERLDIAALEAVRKALFRPHEVNGVAQAAQVLIPVEFVRRAS
jgi:protein TonB